MCRFCEQAVFGQDLAYDPQLSQRDFMRGANLPPDLILYDGAIVTMDPLKPQATAIAIREGVIQAVGIADDLLAGRGRMTRLLRLEGRVVTPGFIDTGTRLPQRRDPTVLNTWIESRARAGFTTVELVELADDWMEYERLSRLIDRRHRLRLRGAIGNRLLRDTSNGELGPGYGNDLLRIDSVLFMPRQEDMCMTLAHAISVHEEGWGIVFDCPSDTDLSAVVQMAVTARDGTLSKMRLVSAKSPEPAARRQLMQAGIELVLEHEHTAPTVMLNGSNEEITHALELLTVKAARIAGISGIAGQLRQGLYADFTILDRSPFSSGAHAPKVLGTWIEGIPVRSEADDVAA